MRCAFSNHVVFPFLCVWGFFFINCGEMCIRGCRMSSLGNNIGCQEYQQADKTLFETRVKGQRPIQRLCTFLWYYSFNFCLFFYCYQNLFDLLCCWVKALANTPMSWNMPIRLLFWRVLVEQRWYGKAHACQGNSIAGALSETYQRSWECWFDELELIACM